MAYTLDTTLGELLADPQAVTVMNQYLPGVSANPMLNLAKGASLRMLLAMPQAAQLGITKEMVQKILDDINKQLKHQ